MKPNFWGWVWCALFAGSLQAAILQVGPGQIYAKPCQAIAAAGPGDTILIDAAGNYSGDVCFIYQTGLTLRGVNGRPHIDAAGKNAGGKGIWVIDGDNTTVDNIEFSGATVADGNGAGIRLETPNLTLRNCYFHNNQDGILTGNPGTGEILIEYSEFGFNGTGTGQTHNIYIGQAAKFTLRYSYSHDSDAGQLVKTRAAENHIEYNRLTSEQGTTSYEIDIPNGGLSYVIGNLIEQGPNDPNVTIVEYLAEGTNPHNPDQRLFIVNNTFVNDCTSGYFVSVNSIDTTPAVVQNNIFAGPGQIVTQASAVMLNNLSGVNPMFANPAAFDYHLLSGSPAINAGSLPGTGAGQLLTPAYEYVHPECGEVRNIVGAIDIGALEFGGAGAPLPCTSGTPPGTSGTATFLSLDTTTSGSWKGVYGGDGYNILNNAISYPSYVAVTASGYHTYTWTPSTTNLRALQKPLSTTDRIASCWCGGSFTISLAFSDTNVHRVALYLLDWEPSGRTEKVDVLDSGNTLLDTRSVSNFGNGQYLVWNLTGQVTLRFTNTGPVNAVVSGLFFGGAGNGSGGGNATGTAAFLQTDTTTKGSWKGVYGADGDQVINDTASIPAYVTVTPTGNSPLTWASSTSDLRALEKGGSATDRIAASWNTATSMTVKLGFSDTATHQVSLYLLDWDASGRTEKLDLLDSNGNLLDTRSVSGFSNGVYLVWNLSGQVTLRLTNTGTTNAVMSGIFFGGAPAGGGSPTGAATFLKTDATTSGSWKGVYGADGYEVIANSSSIPAYVTVTPAGNTPFTWTASTTNLRALQKGGAAADRIAACWEAPTTMTVKLAFSDSNTHQVAVYLLDWSSGGRAERVDVLDVNGNVLDTRTVSAFSNGVYLVWNMSGPVTLQLTRTAGYNALISGIFFK